MKFNNLFLAQMTGRNNWKKPEIRKLFVDYLENIENCLPSLDELISSVSQEFGSRIHKATVCRHLDGFRQVWNKEKTEMSKFPLAQTKEDAQCQLFEVATYYCNIINKEESNPHLPISGEYIIVSDFTRDGIANMHMRLDLPTILLDNSSGNHFGVVDRVSLT